MLDDAPSRGRRARPAHGRRAPRSRRRGRCWRSRVQLLERALPRRLVIAPAAQLGAVADAPGGDVVEVDLHDQLRAQRDPFELLAGAPAAGVRGAALPRLVRPQKADQALLLGDAQTGAVPDDAQL